MRYPAILATISLIVFAGCLVSPAAAQLTQNNNPAAGNGQDGSFVFVLQLDDQSLQDLRNGQPLLSKIPDELRNKVTAVRLEYVRNNNVSPLPIANPNGVSTGQQFGPPIPDFFRNQFNPNITQPASTNFSPQVQPNGSNSGLTPMAPRNEQVPAWNAPRFNNPATGQGTGNQPTNNQPGTNTPTYNSPGTNVAPPFRPTNDSSSQGQPGPNQIDTARQNPSYNTYSQNPNSNSSLQAIAPNRYIYDSNGNPVSQDNRTQQQTYESLLGNMQQQINTLSRQLPGNDQRTDSLIAGHQYPATNNYSWDSGGYGLGGGGLLASVRGSAAQTDHLPSAFIPGNASDEPAIGQRRETASITAAIEDANRKNAFLFFWLMCSIGLNIYLGWISRGFYVRYRELAEELRETFSTV